MAITNCITDWWPTTQAFLTASLSVAYKQIRRSLGIELDRKFNQRD